MVDNSEVNPGEPQPETTPSSKRGKGLILGFVSVAVLIETAMFFFLVPSAEEVSALAEARLVKSVEEDKEEAEELLLEENTVQEFTLGMFGETFSPIGTEARYRVELRLFGLVRQKNLDRLKAEFDAKEGRLRHAIRMKIRNSELSELDENQLGLLQRRILTTCNHLLQGDLLLSIGFQDYQLIQI
jgi:hypothetical protein